MMGTRMCLIVLTTAILVQGLVSANGVKECLAEGGKVRNQCKAGETEIPVDDLCKKCCKCECDCKEECDPLTEQESESGNCCRGYKNKCCVPCDKSDDCIASSGTCHDGSCPGGNDPIDGQSCCGGQVCCPPCNDDAVCESVAGVCRIDDCVGREREFSSCCNGTICCVFR